LRWRVDRRGGRLSKKVLLVNDEEDINTTVRQVLEGKGFEVYSYEDPHLALQNFKHSFYDLVIIDNKMPQMNGVAFYKEIRALDRKVKTCFLTAAHLQPGKFSNDILSSLSHNCFIRIPIENDRLLELVTEIIGG
jgi:two-component system copper resistance phosphate regulon response regulator CusR